MNRDTDRAKMFGRRAAALGLAKLGLLGILAGRMYYLQIVEGSRYATLEKGIIDRLIRIEAPYPCPDLRLRAPGRHRADPAGAHL